MWGMDEVRDQLEEELNEGGWTQDFGEGDLRRSLFRATGELSFLRFHVLFKHRLDASTIPSPSDKYCKKTKLRFRDFGCCLYFDDGGTTSTRTTLDRDVLRGARLPYPFQLASTASRILRHNGRLRRRKCTKDANFESRGPPKQCSWYF